MSKKKVNILWLMSDQHNANCMGVAGHPDVRTPNLDRIAKNGVLFNRAYTNNPVCAPARCTLMSGQYVKTHGISGNVVRDVHSISPNVARLFRENGYETGLVGKAHLPAHWIRDGFEFFRFSDLTDADSYKPQTCHYFNDLIEAGIADLYDHGGIVPGHPDRGDKAFVSELPEEFSLEAWTGRKGVEFLEQRNREKPFFLKVSFQRPHNPFSPPESRAHDYNPEMLTLPENAVDYLERGFAGKPQFMRDYTAVRDGSGYPYRSTDSTDLRVQMAAHFTLITMLDEAIGAVLKKIEEQRELENTVIVYTADHGDFAGEHGMTLKNFGIYESIHRIPFILAGPGIPKGKTIDAIIENTDFYPTLTALAGIENEKGIDGRSVLPEAEGRRNGHEFTVCEWDFIAPQDAVYAVRDDQFRFVHYDTMPEDGELYDCKNDPGELNNLFSDPDYQNVREKMEARLKEYRANTNRVYAWATDALRQKNKKDDPVIRLHKYGARWSEVQDTVRTI
ncbi:MAG: sulfatase-like hydrolase/transferase [Kiritimatiellales bacterium]